LGLGYHPGLLRRFFGGLLEKVKLKNALIILLLCAINSIGQEKSSGVPLDSYSPEMRNSAELDGFFYRISTRYHCSLPASFYMQPMNAGDARIFLKSVDSLDKQNMLSPQESIDLQRIKKVVGSKNSLFSYADVKQCKSLYLGISLADSSRFMVRDSSAFFTRATISPRLSGNLGRFSFYSSVDVWTDHRSDSLWKRFRQYTRIRPPARGYSL
jgi:hypothetical protein